MAASGNDLDVLSAVEDAFRTCERPEHFTNFKHCDECAEHDELLRSRSWESLRIEDVGNPGWDPICFISPAGFAFYLPALARLTLEDAPYGFDWYGVQFFRHLLSDGPKNLRVEFCTTQQRDAVARFVRHLIETRPGLIDRYLSGPDAFEALHTWSNEREAA